MADLVQTRFNRHREKGDIHRNPHFWILIGIIIALFVLYYLDYIVNIKEPEWRWLWSLTLFEFSNHINGALFCIPFIYAALIFKFQGILITWLFSAVILLPRIQYYSYSSSSLITNIVYLLIPLLIMLTITLQRNWRETERRAMAEREESRRTYLAQILTVQEDERKRISREIHDDTTQRLWLLSNQVQHLASKKLCNVDQQAVTELESIKDTILHISDDTRRLSLALRPGMLDDLGLVPAIRWLVDQLSSENSIEAQMTVEGKQRHVGDMISTQLFRIAQEALNNVRHHAAATQVNVLLSFNAETVKLTIRDNGRGFKVKKMSNLAYQNKLGLIGLQERATLLKADLKIISRPNQGTTISIEVRDRELQ